MRTDEKEKIAKGKKEPAIPKFAFNFWRIVFRPTRPKHQSPETVDSLPWARVRNR
jgi:hypothetical protein